jgi:hypothetical protein
MSKASKTSMALSAEFPEQHPSLEFKSQILTSFANAVWHCSSASEVAVLFNETSIRVNSPPLRNAKGIGLGSLMAAHTMLTPNPRRVGSIARVIVIGTSADKKHHTVLNVDPFRERPALLRPLNRGFYHAMIFWRFTGVAIMLLGIALAFLWHWWACILGLVIGAMVFRANSRSAVDFVIQSLRDNPNALNYFNSLGVIWDAKVENVVPDNT